MRKKNDGGPPRPPDTEHAWYFWRRDGKGRPWQLVAGPGDYNEAVDALLRLKGGDKLISQRNPNEVLNPHRRRTK